MLKETALNDLPFAFLRTQKKFEAFDLFTAKNCVAHNCPHYDPVLTKCKILEATLKWSMDMRVIHDPRVIVNAWNEPSICSACESGEATKS